MNNPEDQKEIDIFLKQQKEKYFSKLENEIILMAKNLKEMYVYREVHKVEFSLDMDTNEPYLFAYCSNSKGEELEGLFFDHTISLNGEDINYLIDNKIDFEFDIYVNCSEKELLLRLAKGFMGEEAGDYWYFNRESSIMYKDLNLKILPKEVVKKNKI